MKTFYATLTFLFSLLPIICFAQPSLPTDYFRSFTTGDWAGLPTWQSSHDNITYFPATLIPTASAIGILIQNLHTVTISTSGISLANTSIQSGGILQITSTFVYTIGGTGDNLVVESGGILLLNFTTLSAPAGLGTALIKTSGKVVANAVNSAAGANAIGDNYLNVNSKFTYQDKSIFEWNIANYIFNSTGLKDYFKTTSGTDIPILRISLAPVASFGTSSNNLLNCLLEANAPFNISGSGIKTFRGGLSGTGTINQTDGFITLPDASSVLDGSLTINTITSGLRFTNGAVVPVGANVKITVPVENQIINKQSGNLQVNGVLDITNCRISNTGASASVTIANGGVLKTSNTSGFSGGGAAIVAEPIILETNSTVEFNRAGDQNFNDRTDFKNLTFSGSGIKRPANAFNPVGTVKITENAILDCIHNIGDAGTNLTMDGGRLILSTGIVQPTMGGVYNLTGGVVEFAGASFKRIRSETYQNIEVTGSDVNNSSSNIVLRDPGTFTVKSGGVFTINDNGITGPFGIQTIIVENGATFNSGNNEGFHGFTATFTNNSSIHSNVENIILHPGSTVVYSRDNNQQITNANGLSYQNLIIAGTTGIKTAPPGTLSILGNLTKSGASNFEHNNGTVFLNGTNQSFAGLTYNNLLLDNAGIKTLTGNAEIIDSICLSNLLTRPATVLALGDNFICLKSTATKTARVGIIPNDPGVDITYGNGRFVVERYFPPRRAWRLITAPITADASRNSIYRSWQSGGAATLLSGTFVSGKNPDPLNNGLDITPLNNSSLKTFDAATSKFAPVSNTKTTLISGTTGQADNFGFFIFIRGDRSTTNLFYPPYSLPTTLRDTGKILIKDQSFSISGLENIGYSLLGNPYASPVRVTGIVANTPGINNDFFYAYDPHLNIADGGYITVFRGADNEWYTNLSSPGNQDSIIQSGQAFFVQRISYSASVVFKEGDKWPVNNPGIFRPLTENNPITKGHYFRTNLYLSDTDSTRTLADGAIVEFNGHNTNAIDSKDAVKFINIRESLGLQREGNAFSVERRNILSEFDTLFLKLTKTTKRSYQFEFISENLDPLLMGVLEDSYTGDKTVISLSTPSTFSFDVNDDSASSAPDRFQVTFKMLPTSPLPVVISTVRARKQEDDILIEWEVESQLNILQYEIERSGNGLHFNKVHTTAALTQSGLVFYKWLDVNAIHGDNFYRIKIIDNNGAINYSHIVKISFNKEVAGIRVSPNPSVDGSVALQLINEPKGTFHLCLMNNAGQLLGTQLFNNEGGNTVKTISARTGNLAPGIYHLHITNPTKEEITIKILVQSK